MGDLADDTAVERVDDDRFRATVSPAWAVQGPLGGYVASIGLRAIAAVSPFTRPASFFCQFLGVADFDTVDLRVTTLRSARTAAAHRVEITQEGRPILEATTWSIGAVDGLEHDLTEPPRVPSPDELKTVPELFADAGIVEDRFAFWDNLVLKPTVFDPHWPPPGPKPPVWREWCRFTPTATFDDPWVDACRALVLVDIQSWPAAQQPHAWSEPPFIAPSLDLYVAFHDPRPASAWLLCDGHGPIARDGLFGWTGRLWTTDGHLVASGGGQLLSRRVPPPP
jgi:acyl-CoA thioesterase-2